MNERIRELRLAMRMSQEEFGKLLGISKSGVSEIESGRRNVTDQHIIMLKNSNVSEEWIRTGRGEMFIELSRDEQISSFVGEILRNEEESFKKRFVSMLAKMDEEDWIALERIIDKMQKEKD